MRRQKRTFRPGSRIIPIFLLFLLSCSFAILEINQHLSTATRMTADQPPPSGTPSSTGISSQDDKPVGKPAAIYKIVIDPGHGGKDPGQSGASGKEEKAYTLALARKVYDLLKREPMFEPYMTRDDDTFISLEDRAAMANELGADAFISIHGNTYDDSEVSGTETYFYSNESESLADAIHERLLAADGFEDRGVRREEWKVLTQSDVPAILAEVGYLTNKDDESLLLSKRGQARIAQAMVDGLKQYFEPTL